MREEEGDIEVLSLDLRSSEQALTPSPALSLICEGLQLNAQRPCTLRALTCWSPFPGRGSTSGMCTFTCRLTPALFHQARGPPGDSFEHISSVHLGLSGQGHVEPRKRRHFGLNIPRRRAVVWKDQGKVSRSEDIWMNRLRSKGQSSCLQDFVVDLIAVLSISAYLPDKMGLRSPADGPGCHLCVCVRALLPQTPFPQWV